MRAPFRTEHERALWERFAEKTGDDEQADRLLWAWRTRCGGETPLSKREAVATEAWRRLATLCRVAGALIERGDPELQAKLSGIWLDAHAAFVRLHSDDTTPDLDAVLQRFERHYLGDDAKEITC